MSHLVLAEEEIRAVLEPLERATTLPARAYSSADVLALEQREIFGRAWLCVGSEHDLVEPGAWLLADVVPEGIVVVRGGDGELRAFYNVCRHRGSTLVSSASGCSSAFICPYHGWSYELDGRLRSAPHTESLCGFRSDEHALRPARVAIWNGFVFVCLDPETAALEAWLGAVPEHFRRAEIAGLRRGRRVEWEVGANWKLVVENFQESHHFDPVHPELESHTPFRLSSSFYGDKGPWLGGVMELTNGAETVSLDGRLHGRPRIAGADARSVVDCLLWPNLLTSLQPDYLLTYRLWPLGVDRTRVTAEIWFPNQAFVDGFAPGDVYEFWDITNRQDKEICERQQRGIASSAYLPGRYVGVEDGMHAFDRRVARVYLDAIAPTPPPPPRLCGIWGRPYLDLEPFFDLSLLDEIHEEICHGLCFVDTSYTGGSLKWLGVAAPWVMDDEYADLGHVIERMSEPELARFVALADDPSVFDLARRSEYRFGDETDHPLNERQMLYLKYRHGVYFPWKVVFHLLENERWEDKHSGAGKSFDPDARRFFPKTLCFIESLPFTEIGRALIFGLEANDHATLHRDSEPGRELSIAQSITFCPGGNKRFYLCDADGGSYTPVDSRIYWFNDMDYHGVEPDPFFRYSVRVDGAFDPAFVRRLRRAV